MRRSHRHLRTVTPFTAIAIQAEKDLRAAGVRIRAAFLEPLIEKIAVRRRWGWSVERITTWLSALLRDSYLGVIAAGRGWFVSAVVARLDGTTTVIAAPTAVRLAA